ncbi:MAG TPA: hypothetical protein VF543_03055 [Pyrinomonadaceae bacterium]|jgi:hypothetical protein
MFNITRSLITAFLIFIFALNNLIAAQESEQEAYSQALPQLTRLMGSEKAAREHLSQLWAFSRRADRSFVGLARLTQRVQVAGVNGDYFLQTTYACGEIAAALGADDSEYFSIMLVIFDMKLKNVSAYSGLESLVQMSVPAYRLLARAIGKSEEFTKRLVRQDKARVDVAADALLAMMTDEYRGSIDGRKKK